MSHSPVFDRLRRAFAVGLYCEKKKISTSEGLERIAEMQRRTLLKGAIGAGLVMALPRAARGAPRPPSVDVGIVGGGLAGLACADRLRVRGVNATVYESRDRIGGRQWSLAGTFPGQVAERGGELIDTLHKTILGYAQTYGLAKEDMAKKWLPGETLWYFGGQHVPEATIVDEFRDLVDAMRPDLATLSNEVNAQSFTPFDRTIDLLSIAEYLDSRGAAPNIRKAIDVSYTIEYGRSIEEQSALNFIFFIHADKRSKFTPFGVFSDERYHIIGGNDQIATNLANGLGGPIELEAKLLSVSRTPGGRVELTLSRGGSTFTRQHDAVVLALPFSTLRNVQLNASLGLPPQKIDAIQTLQYGTNAKLNIGFNSRFWGAQACDGATYSDLANHQTTWEVNPINATSTRAVLVDYSGGARGASLNPNNVNLETRRFLDDLDLVLPGARANATQLAPNQYRAHLQHWPSDPHALGSYTCNQPGYFTTIAGHEATPVQNVYFAGEHTDSFYEFQGFMEGAATSGIRAANEILSDFA